MRGKRDLTEASIVAALQKAGCVVWYAEKEPYDLVVSRAGANYLIEVKNAAGRNRMTEAQRAFQAQWAGPYAVVHTPAQALRAVGL